ncbi:hypothetical protein V5799_024588 [Amblyomma americanum]|uniref:Uncharacterized protein n=1 Tax=Amblyomma americanum TaxID=6943 RepID=A0AAQ4EC52_AMBAM
MPHSMQFQGTRRLGGNSGGYGAPFHGGSRPPGFYTGRPPFRDWRPPLLGPRGRPPWSWRPTYWRPFMPGRPPYTPPRPFGPRPGAHSGWGPSPDTYTDCVEENRNGSPRETGVPSATGVQQPGLPSGHHADAYTPLLECTSATFVKEPSPEQTKSDRSKRVLINLPRLDTHVGGIPAKRLKPHDPESPARLSACGDHRDCEQEDAKAERGKGVGTETPADSIAKVRLPHGDRTGINSKYEAARVQLSPLKPSDPWHSRHSDTKTISRKLKSVVRVPEKKTVSSKEPAVCNSISMKSGNEKIGHNSVPAELRSAFCKRRAEEMEPILSTSGLQQCCSNFSAHLILVARADSTTSKHTKQTVNWRSSPTLTNTRGITAVKATGAITEAKDKRGTSESEVALGTSESEVALGTTESEVALGTTESEVALGTTESEVALGTTESEVALGTTESEVALGTTESEVALGTTESEVALGTTESEVARGTTESKSRRLHEAPQSRRLHEAPQSRRLHEAPQSRRLHEAPQSRRLHEAPQSRRLHEAPQSRRLHEAPQSRRLHEAPQSRRLHEAPQSRRLHEAPQSRRLHEAPQSRRLHEAPQSRRLHEAPQSRRLHEAPQSRRLHEAPQSRRLHEAPQSRRLHEAPQSRRLHEAPQSRRLHEAPQNRRLHMCPHFHRFLHRMLTTSSVQRLLSVIMNGAVRLTVLGVPTSPRA